MNVESKTLSVRQTLQRQKGGVFFAEPKSDRSRRTLSLPDTAVRAIKNHRQRQNEERLASGGLWRESGLVFTSTVGSPLDERNVRCAFNAIRKAAGLGPMRIHDLRHTCATLLLAQGVHPRVVMETLEDSQVTLTLDTYSHVLPGLTREAASRMDDALTPQRVVLQAV